MAHLIVDFYADALGVETRMHVLLPQRLTGRAKTLYLLHGMSDDEGTWMRRTAIDRYAEEKELAVVMPDGGLGWYTDAALLGGRLRPGGGRARLGKRPLCRRHGAGRSRPAAQNLHVVRHGRLSLRPEHAHARSSARAGLRPDL